MKNLQDFLVIPILLFAGILKAQTLYVPSGTAGIGTSTNGYVGIGTTATPSSLFTIQGAGTLGSTFQQKTTNGSQTLAFGVNATAAEVQSQGSVPLYLNYGGNNVIMSATGGNVGIGNPSPAYKLDIEGGQRVKNSSAASGAYTTFRLQGPDYGNGLELDFFGNNNIPSDLNWSYGGGPGSVAIVNVNPKPLTFGTGNVGRMLIDANGNVGIGTTQADYKLTVNGKIKAEEVQVLVDVPDYVFENNYSLMPLVEVEKYINEIKHLPAVPRAKAIAETGWQVGEMNNKLLEKIEELTLYMIELKKENEKLKQRVNNIEADR